MRYLGPIIEVLKELGGSGSPEEVRAMVASRLAPLGSHPRDRADRNEPKARDACGCGRHPVGDKAWHMSGIPSARSRSHCADRCPRHQRVHSEDADNVSARRLAGLPPASSDQPLEEKPFALACS